MSQNLSEIAYTALRCKFVANLADNRNYEEIAILLEKIRGVKYEYMKNRSMIRLSQYLKHLGQMNEEGTEEYKLYSIIDDCLKLYQKTMDEGERYVYGQDSNNRIMRVKEGFNELLNLISLSITHNACLSGYDRNPEVRARKLVERRLETGLELVISEHFFTHMIMTDLLINYEYKS